MGYNIGVISIICGHCSASGFNQFGLYHDDCLYENDDVKEALRRLPAVSRPHTGSVMTEVYVIAFSAPS